VTTPPLILPLRATALPGSKFVAGRRPAWPDTCFAYFGLVLYGGAIVTPLRDLRGAGPQQIGESEPVMAVSQFLILGILVCVVAGRWRRIMPLLRYMTPYFFIIGLCFASSVWSEYPLATVRRTVTLGVCVMFGIYCYDAFGISALIRMISRVAIFLGVLSIVVFLAAPSIGHNPTPEYPDAMRGVFSQKNGLADFMLLGIACCCYRFFENRHRLSLICSTLLLLLCIVMSFSVSSLMIATIVLVATIWLLLRARPNARLMFAFFSLSVCSVIIAGFLLVPNDLFQMMGRDASLTGRLPLWQVVLETIQSRPFLGYGYSGFWNADSIDVLYLWQRAGWPAPDSHNGYLDIVLQVGIVGLALYGWLWIQIIRLAIRANRAGTLPVVTWILLFMLINVLVNLDEGPLPWADDFTAMAPAALLSVSIWEEKRRRAIAAVHPGRVQTMRGLIPSLNPGLQVQPNRNPA